MSTFQTINYYYIFYSKLFLGLNLDILLSFSNIPISSSVGFFGTIIFTSAINSPLPPFPSLYPFPGILTFSPLSIPCGICKKIVSPIVSIDTFFPKTASHGAINKFVYMSIPLNSNFLSFCIFIFINKSPFFPPFSPFFLDLLILFFHHFLFQLEFLL